MTSTAILIPARYNSSRFPGKPLTLLDGAPMVKRVYDKCVATGYDTYVLTDDMSIANLFNDNTCRVDTADYQNGTERCAGAIDLIRKYDQYINVQGDMPDVTEEMIEKCAESLSYNYAVSTVYTEMPQEMQHDPNSVKMIHAYPNQALWFGRGLTGYGEWHLGVYGYKRHALVAYPNLKVTQEEEVESLEQLRWLKSGWQIGAQSVYFNGIEINTPEDADKFNKRFSVEAVYSNNKSVIVKVSE